MRRKALLWICVAAIAGAGFYVGWRRLDKNTAAPSPAPPSSSTPTARVKVVAARTGTISEQLIVYGDVIPAPGSQQTVSVPFQSHVLHIGVNAGQRISAGDPLLEVEPGPDAELQLQTAQDANTAAQENLNQVEGRLRLQLATNDQVIQARQAAALAKARLDSLQSRQRSAPDGRIQSRVSGLVNSVAVREGQLVNAGATLLEVVEGERLEARLGIEPEDLERVNPRASVRLTRSSDTDEQGFAAPIRRFSRVVNPSTRLVEIFVPLPPESNFLLGEPVAGRLTVARSRGLIVPRSAALPEGEAFVLYTVRDGKAVKHMVKIGVDNGREVQIVSPQLDGEPVVVSGNYELRDGMAVVVEQGP